VPKKNTDSFVVDAKKAKTTKRTTDKTTGKVATPGRKISPQSLLLAQQALSSQSKGKVYTVTLAQVKGSGKTTVVWTPNKALEVETTEMSGKVVKRKLPRRKIVGKYEVDHLPAPKSKLKLDDETRASLLAAMVLN